jgi:hypothetical protein
MRVADVFTGGVAHTDRDDHRDHHNDHEDHHRWQRHHGRRYNHHRQCWEDYDYWGW